MKYSEAQRNQALADIAAGQTAKLAAKKNGVNVNTLIAWKRQANNLTEGSKLAELLREVRRKDQVILKQAMMLAELHK